jgi:hypothetical protein
MMASGVQKRFGFRLSLLRGVGLIAILAGIYVLSMGPVSLLLQKETMSQSTFNTLYSPIFSVVNRFQAARTIWHWYMDFWWIGPGETRHP